jgi:hypothetical protein
MSIFFCIFAPLLATKKKSNKKRNILYIYIINNFYIAKLHNYENSIKKQNNYILTLKN